MPRWVIVVFSIPEIHNLNFFQFQVYYNIGRISYDKKESETALKFYKKAIELHPNYESAHMNLGNLFRELQEYNKAKYHLLKAVEIL